VFVLGERSGEDDSDVVVVVAAFYEVGCEDAVVGEVVADDVVVAGFGFAVDSELVSLTIRVPPLGSRFSRPSPLFPRLVGRFSGSKSQQA
jgi:hypothetical protein